MQGVRKCAVASLNCAEQLVDLTLTMREVHPDRVVITPEDQLALERACRIIRQVKEGLNY